LNRKKIIYVISAPSGTGKTTICNKILAEDKELKLSISYTSRPAKKGEQNGIDYYFVSNSEFEKMIEDNAFVEWANVYGNYYGTPWKAFDELEKSDNDILLEIDVQGGKSIIDKYPSAVLIFILPPSIEELRKRLVLRGRDDSDEINRRIDIVKKEIEYMKYYDYIVVNDNLEVAKEQVLSVVRSERLKSTVLFEYYKKFFQG